MSFLWIPVAIGQAMTYIPAIAPLIMLGMTMIIFWRNNYFCYKIYTKIFKNGY